MMSLDLLHINLRLAATVPMNEPWSVAAKHAGRSNAPLDSGDAPPAHPGSNPSAGSVAACLPGLLHAGGGAGQGSGDRFRGSLAGLSGVQSQLAGLKRRSALRPLEAG